MVVSGVQGMARVSSSVILCASKKDRKKKDRQYSCLDMKIFLKKMRWVDITGLEVGTFLDVRICAN